MLLKYSFVLKTLTVIFALVLQNSLMCLLQIFNVICVYKIHQKATNKRNLVGIRKKYFLKRFYPKTTACLSICFTSVHFSSALSVSILSIDGFTNTFRQHSNETNVELSTVACAFVSAQSLSSWGWFFFSHTQQTKENSNINSKKLARKQLISISFKYSFKSELWQKKQTEQRHRKENE